jgi:hypothetical protein
VVKDGKKLSELDHLNQTARQMLDPLAWWAGALKRARETTFRQAAWLAFSNKASGKLLKMAIQNEHPTR